MTAPAKIIKVAGLHRGERGTYIGAPRADVTVRLFENRQFVPARFRLFSRLYVGERGGDRTLDHVIKSHVLYH